jgi:hypothetical protein
VEWVVREGVGQGEEMTQALYAHMNNKRKKLKKIKQFTKKKRKFLYNKRNCLYIEEITHRVGENTV